MFGQHMLLAGAASGGGGAGPWPDIDTFSYDSKSLDTQTQVTRAAGLAISADGSKLYCLDNVARDVNQYAISTPFDISTGAYDSKRYDSSSVTSGAQSMFLSPDGGKLFILGNGDDTAHQFTLSTDFDISTASSDTKSFDFSSQEDTPYGITFSPDGSKMYVVGKQNDSVFQYTLSSAWDISTASYDSKSLDCSTQEGSPEGVAVDTSGTRVYVIGLGGDIYQYNLSTPFDVSTGSYASKTLDVSSQASSAVDLAFGDDGAKLYVYNKDADIVYQYSS